jgi:hypothetical protein
MSLLFIHLVIYVGLVHDKFSLIMVRKAHWWRTFSKCKAKLNYRLIEGPLF